MSDSNKNAAANAAAKPAAATTAPTGTLVPPTATSAELNKTLPDFANISSDIQIVLNLFDKDFQVVEIWDSLRALADIGQKATDFLKQLGLMKFNAAACLAPVTHSPALTACERDAHLVADLKAACNEACGGIPIAATGDSPGSLPPIAMNPLFANLLARLIASAIQKLLDKWNLTQVV